MYQTDPLNRDIRINRFKWYIDTWEYTGCFFSKLPVFARTHLAACSKVSVVTQFDPLHLGFLTEENVSEYLDSNKVFYSLSDNIEYWSNKKGEAIAILMMTYDDPFIQELGTKLYELLCI